MENDDIRARVLAAVGKAERAVESKGGEAAEGFNPGERARMPSFPPLPPTPDGDDVAEWRDYVRVLEDRISEMSKAVESRSKMLRLATDPKAIADAILSANKQSLA